MTTESIIIDSGHQFNYDPNRDYNANFNEWRVLNSQERSAWSEPQLSFEEAQAIFDKMYGHKK
jgi:hypothetical protein